MAETVIDFFQVVHIKHHNGERGLAVVFDLAVYACLCLQKGVLVFHARQRVNIGLSLGLFETFFDFLFLADLRIHIIEADNQTRSFLLLHQGGFHLDVYRPAVHHDPIPKGEDPAARYLCHNVFLGESREETLQIRRVIGLAGDLSHLLKEILSVLRLL